MSLDVVPAATQREPRVSLRAVSVFGAVGVGLSAVYAATGWGIPCPFRMATGWLCPVCGATTMGSELLHGHLGAAWAANPVVLVALVGLALLGLGWALEVATRRRFPVLDAWARLQRWFSTRPGLAVLGVAIVVWILARNL